MSSGLRERKKAETRAALQDAAIRLAGRDGVDKVSVEAIAAAVGVSSRTFFNYFSTKEDAIIGMSPALRPPVADYLHDRPADEPPLEALRQALQASVERLQEDPDRWTIRRRLVQDHPGLATRYAARLAETERDLVEEIGRRLDLDPERDTYPATVVGAALAATRVAMSIWQGHDDPSGLAALIDEVFAHLASGLPPPPG